jgi:hypothetical protein
MKAMVSRLLDPERFNLLRGMLVGLGVFVLFGMNTALISNPFFIRQVPIYFWDYIFLGTTSILAGYYFGLEDECRTSSDNRYALFGGVTGFFAFACPICNSLLLALFSTATIMTYLEPLRPFLGLASTAILIVFIFRGSSCEVNPEENKTA